MFEESTGGRVRSVYPVESLCAHCKKHCLSLEDMKGYIQIGSVNIRENCSELIECSGFESRDGIYAVRVEVERDCPRSDLIFLQQLHNFYENLPENIRTLDEIRKREEGIDVKKYEGGLF